MLYILYKLPIYQHCITLALSYDRDGKRGILLCLSHETGELALSLRYHWRLCWCFWQRAAVAQHNRATRVQQRTSKCCASLTLAQPISPDWTRQVAPIQTRTLPLIWCSAGWCAQIKISTSSRIRQRGMFP